MVGEGAVLASAGEGAVASGGGQLHVSFKDKPISKLSAVDDTVRGMGERTSARQMWRVKSVPVETARERVLDKLDPEKRGAKMLEGEGRAVMEKMRSEVVRGWRMEVVDDDDVGGEIVRLQAMVSGVVWVKRGRLGWGLVWL